MNKNIVVSKNALVCFFLLVPFFRPIVAGYYFVTEKFYAGYSLALFVYIIFYFFLHKKKVNTITMFIIALQVWMMISTLISGGAIGSSFYRVQVIVGLALIIERYSKNIQVLIETLMLHFEISIFLNLIMMILKPSGFFVRSNAVYLQGTEEWLFGVSNYFIIWLFPGFVIAYLYKSLKKRNFRFYSLTVAILLTLILKSSGTTIVGIGLIITSVIIPGLRKYFTPLKALIVSAILFVLIVVLQSSNFLKPLVEGILEKDMTFSNRLLIWDNAIKAIQSNPFIGYGIIDNNKAAAILGDFKDYFWMGATHAHNQILQIGFQGGVTAIILYISAILVAYRKCANFWNNPTVYFLSFALFTYTIVGITEVFEQPLMYLILILPFYADNIINGT